MNCPPTLKMVSVVYACVCVSLCVSQWNVMCVCVHARAHENEWSVYVLCVHMCICESGGVVYMHVCGREYGEEAVTDIFFPHLPRPAYGGCGDKTFGIASPKLPPIHA